MASMARLSPTGSFGFGKMFDLVHLDLEVFDIDRMFVSQSAEGAHNNGDFVFRLNVGFVIELRPDFGFLRGPVLADHDKCRQEYGFK